MSPNPVHRVGERWLIFFFTVAVFGALTGAIAFVQRWSTPPNVIIYPSPTAKASLPPTNPAIPSAKIPISITVMVSGAVQQPGLVALPANATIADAISAAGGFADHADPRALDLAALLADGALLSVPSLTDASQNSAAAMIDLNTASASELESLPGIGPKTAQIIIAHRPYRRLSDLNRIPGIGEATINRLRGLVTVNE